MQGINFSSIYRTGGVRYSTRPSANRVAARSAWDHFAKGGPVEWVQLLDGYWGCRRPGGNIEEVEAIHFRRDW